MFDLSFRDQVLDRSGNFFDRHVRIAAVLSVRRSKALQGSIHDFTNMLGSAVEPNHLAFVGNLETELRADQRPIANRLQRFADQFFIDERPVALRGVEKCNAPIHRRTDDGDGFLAIGGRSKAEA